MFFQGLIFACEFFKVYFIPVQLVFDGKSLLFQGLYLFFLCFELGFIFHFCLYQLFYLALCFSFIFIILFLCLYLHLLDAIPILFLIFHHPFAYNFELLIPILQFLLKLFPFLLKDIAIFLDLFYFSFQMFILFQLVVQFLNFSFMFLLQRFKIPTQFIEFLRILIDGILELAYLVLFLGSFLGRLVAILLTITSQCPFHLLLLSQLTLQFLNFKTQGLHNRLLNDSLYQFLHPHDGKLLRQWTLLQGLKQLILHNERVERSGKSQHIIQITNSSHHYKGSNRLIKLSLIKIRFTIVMRIPSADQFMFIDNVCYLLFIFSLSVGMFPLSLGDFLLAELQLHRHKLLRCDPVNLRVLLTLQMRTALLDPRQ